MNRIDIRELWNDTGQFCAEIDIDGKRVASVYSPNIERMLVNTLADRHCEIWRAVRTGTPVFVRRGGGLIRRRTR